ncbi:hypothetical protein IAR55_007075 [Kwoniella newhampshirensis]|uniref:Uncharacterized protein n=1 Tax=Kwoniella newhampshirensis TaxID=1651941 RepID=A0AAW0YQ66_9TREE
MALLQSDYNIAYNNLPSLTPQVMSSTVKDVWPEGVDDVSVEIDIPSFNFDWALDKEAKSGNSITTKSETDQASRLIASMSIKSGTSSLASPPSSSTPPPRLSHSARSSLSSAHLASLTDASTASASSLVPTPPGSGVSMREYAIQSHNTDSGGSGGSGRMYGGRRFQRVVSAPLSRQKPDADDMTAATAETSMVSLVTTFALTR